MRHDDISVYTKYNRDRLASLLAIITSDEESSHALVAKLVDRCSGIDGLLVTPVDELEEILSPDGVAFIRTVAAITSRRLREGFKFGEPQSRYRICEYLKAAFLCEPSECVMVVPLGEKDEPLCCEIASRGTVNASDIAARGIAEIALLRGSKRVVIAHNHPRGLAKASDEDISTTKVLVSSLFRAGVELAYHVIVAGQECDIIEVGGSNEA
jgi:DNA repair protein RadC